MKPRTTISGPLLAAAAVLATGLQACSGERGAPEATDLTVSDVYITEPALGERAAMYLAVSNAGTADDELLSISTDVARVTALHRTVENAGRVSMEPVTSLTVPAGGELRLKPGGYHAMLSELQREFAAGDAIEVTLHFRDAGDVVVRGEVRKYVDIERMTSGDAGRKRD